MKDLMKALCCILCAVAQLLLLPGCSPGRNPPSGTPTWTSEKEKAEISVGAELPEPLPEPCAPTAFACNKEALSAWIRSLSLIEVPFETLDEIYDLDRAAKVYAEQIPHISKHRWSGFLRDGRVDQEALLQHVLENNRSFDRMEHNGALFYTELEDEELLAQIIAFLAEGIEAELPGITSAAELAELDCVLGDLCIFESTGLSAAAVTENNVLTVNEPMVKMMALHAGTEDGLGHTIIHESKHLLQSPCSDYRTAPARPLGIGCRTDRLKPNPYRWTWLLEAAAERTTVRQLGDQEQTYHYYIGYLETLDLSALLSPRAETGYDLDHKVLTKDQAGAFQLLGLGQGMGEKELIRMLLSMEIIQNRAEDYPEGYEKTYGRELTDAELDRIRHNFRLDFLLSASKLFYLHLARALAEAEAAPSLEDIFYLLSLWEADLNYHLDYSDAKPQGELASFMQAYLQLQQTFFEALALDLPGSDISRSFCGYSPFVQPPEGPPTPNSRLSWLSPEKRAWLMEKAGSERMKFAPPMEELLKVPCE